VYHFAVTVYPWITHSAPFPNLLPEPFPALVELGNDAAFVASSIKTQKAGGNCHAQQYFSGR
jgi:hypothetical protein